MQAYKDLVVIIKFVGTSTGSRMVLYPRDRKLISRPTLTSKYEHYIFKELKINLHLTHWRFFFLNILRPFFSRMKFCSCGVVPSTELVGVPLLPEWVELLPTDSFWELGEDRTEDEVDWVQGRYVNNVREYFHNKGTTYCVIFHKSVPLWFYQQAIRIRGKYTCTKW